MTNNRRGHRGTGRGKPSIATTDQAIERIKQGRLVELERAREAPATDAGPPGTHP